MYEKMSQISTRFSDKSPPINSIHKSLIVCRVKSEQHDNDS